MYVTSSPTAALRTSSAIRVSASSAGPSACNRARASASVSFVGSSAAVARAARTSVSMRSGAMPGAAASRRAPQSPYTSSKSSRRSDVRPSVSIVACRSVRPLASKASSGSCHGCPSTTASGRARPVSGSASAATCGRSRGSSQGSPRRTNSGYTHSRSRSSNPAVRERSASSSICGQGRSGFTWSIVSGETPPQSSIPAPMSRSYSESTRFGGA